MANVFVASCHSCSVEKQSFLYERVNFRGNPMLLACFCMFCIVLIISHPGFDARCDYKLKQMLSY